MHLNAERITRQSGAAVKCLCGVDLMISAFFLNTGGKYCAQPSPTSTPTATPAESCVVKEMSLCNSAVSAPPTDFMVEMSCPVDQVQPSGFRVNNIGANSFTVSKSTITFHYNTSPAVPGLNTIHILFDAIFCCSRPVNEFNCTFTLRSRHTYPNSYSNINAYAESKTYTCHKSPPYTASAPVDFANKKGTLCSIRFL